jgi:peptidoglycan-N-acetylmuramic acid deacetylase
MKTRGWILALVVAVLLCAVLGLSGCTSCARNLTSSIVPPMSSRLPTPSVAPIRPGSSQSPIQSDPFLSGMPEISGPSSSITPPRSSGEESALSALAMSADFLEIGALSNTLVTWGPGTQRDEFNRSAACVQLQEQYGHYNADFIGPNEKRVTLTFDEGYENGYTASILDTLKEKNVQAIFFLTGYYVRSQHELIQRMIDEGHILGNHSDSHKVYANELNLQESFDDAKYMQDYLRKNFNYEMRLFRFPEGAFCEQSLALIQQMGYRSLFWSFAYADWDPNNQMGVEAAMKKITPAIHPGEIMLLHTAGPDNAQLLPGLIDQLREQGYEIGPYDALKQ